jgi:AcrR family transcriptional regulator
MPAEPPRSPARRADAERNREKILAAARSAFADPDAEISMAEIARRAGVGMATLYRNFPGRQQLLEALYTDEVDLICASADAVRSKPPEAALLTWLDDVFAFFTSKRQVGTELLKHSESGNPFFSDNRKRVLTAGQPLLTAAQRGHAVRDDLNLEQVLDMISAIAKIDGGPGYVQPILQSALDGLRPPTSKSPGPTTVD